MSEFLVQVALALYRSPSEPPLADGWLLIGDGTVRASGSGRPPAPATAVAATLWHNCGRS